MSEWEEKGDRMIDACEIELSSQTKGGTKSKEKMCIRDRVYTAKLNVGSEQLRDTIGSSLWLWNFCMKRKCSGWDKN